jgi:HD-like signal output (HDOD) protein
MPAPTSSQEQSSATSSRTTASTSARLRVQPAIASRVIELMVRNEGGLTELVEADPSLCAVVVRAANSAHLGLSRRVGGVRQAMVMLGQDASTALAVARTADLVFEADESSPPLASWVWPQAVAAARAAALLAPSFDANPEHASTAALLQNLGLLMGGRHDAEHAGLTATLLESWNFPDQIVSAIRNHHRSLDDVVAPLDRVVVCARTLAAEVGLPDSKPVAPLREVVRAGDLSRNAASSIVREIERSLENLIRLAGVK